MGMVVCRNDVAVTCDWAPDGRHFLTATVAPRLNVDNGYQIWRCPLVLLLEACSNRTTLSAITTEPSVVLQHCRIGPCQELH